MAGSKTIIPTNEQARMAAVRRYNILDTPSDAAFNRLTSIAARLFQVPIAIVSIVDTQRIWFKSHHGLEVQQIGRDPGLCASVILQNDVYSVIDAKVDPRTLSNPLVAGEFGLRFYAAAPLCTSDGFNLGTICVIDRQPRQITEEEKSILKDLAAIVIDELELRLAALKVQLETSRRIKAEKEKEKAEKLAKTDALTGLKNRGAFDIDMINWLALLASNFFIGDVAVVLIDLDGLKALNDTMGHQQGDALLRSFATALRSVFRHEDTAYRLGGDEYALLLQIKTGADLKSVKKRITEVVEATRLFGFEQADASVGIATLCEANGSSQKALGLADARMYAEKQEHRRRKN